MSLFGGDLTTPNRVATWMAAAPTLPSPILGQLIGSMTSMVYGKLNRSRIYSQTFTRMTEDIDFDAGAVLDGRMKMDQAAAALEELVVDVARGKLTKPEALGHREYFVMYKHQDTPPLQIGCRA